MPAARALSLQLQLHHVAEHDGAVLCVHARVVCEAILQPRLAEQVDLSRFHEPSSVEDHRLGRRGNSPHQASERARLSRELGARSYGEGGGDRDLACATTLSSSAA